jgi:hypothetical protein
MPSTATESPNSDGEAQALRNFFSARTMAAAFANTAAFLYERDLKQSPPSRPFHVTPFVVNASFAVELYLKALGYRNRAPLRGHELLKLFEALPEDARSEIQAASARVAAKTEPPQYLSPRSALSQLNNAFAEWRYTHEKEELGPISLTSVVLLLQVMHEACANGDA